MREATAGHEEGGSHPLDNAVWHALAGEQHRFALGDVRARRFPPALAPFAGMADRSPAAFDALRGLIDAYGPAALFSPDEIPTPAGLSVVRRATLHQMIWQGTLDDMDPSEHVPLTEADVPEMLALIAGDGTRPVRPAHDRIRRLYRCAQAGPARRDDRSAAAGQRPCGDQRGVRGSGVSGPGARCRTDPLIDRDHPCAGGNAVSARAHIESRRDRALSGTRLRDAPRYAFAGAGT